MIGESYLAWVQWFTAAMQPPHLACIAPFDAGADMYRDVAYHGGIMAVGFPTAWHMCGDPRQLPPRQARAGRQRGRLGHALERHATTPPATTSGRLRYADFSKIQVPVFSIGILHKVGIHLRGNIRGYETVTTPKKLLLCHGDFEGDEMAIFNSREMRQLLLRWYDHWLKGNDTGLMDEDPVTVFVRNREIYRPEKDWPLPRRPSTGTCTCRRGPSGGVESLNDGRRSTWAAAAPIADETALRSPTRLSRPGLVALLRAGDGGHGRRRAATR